MGEDRVSRGPTAAAALPTAVFLAAFATSCSGAEGDPARPNVVVMMADDQAHGMLGGRGHPVLETPSLDRLAASGALCRNAFVTTSLCSPSRVSFLTGQWARTHGVVTNSQPLDPSALTYATALADAGYETACFGKWHMGARPGPRPGFETWASYDGQGVYSDCVFDVDGRQVPSTGFVDDVTTDYVLEFLGRSHERPFLAYVGFKAAHGPREPAPRFAGLFADVEPSVAANARRLPPFPRRHEWDDLVARAGVDDDEYALPSEWADSVERVASTQLSEEQQERQRAYWRLIVGLDESVGRILDALDRLDLARDTIVVYASDNGFSNGEHGLSGKRSAYEESMRIVLTVRAPGAAEGAVLEDLILNVDLAPTLLDLCGVAVPATMQGRSFAPLLRGEPVEWRADFLYEYFRESDFLTPWVWFAHAVPNLVALRTEEAALIVYPEHPSWTELYRIGSDPGQLHNLVGSDPDEDHLRARLGQLDLELGAKPRTRHD